MKKNWISSKEIVNIFKPINKASFVEIKEAVGDKIHSFELMSDAAVAMLSNGEFICDYCEESVNKCFCVNDAGIWAARRNMGFMGD